MRDSSRDFSLENTIFFYIPKKEERKKGKKKKKKNTEISKTFYDRYRKNIKKYKDHWI